MKNPYGQEIVELPKPITPEDLKTIHTIFVENIHLFSPSVDDGSEDDNRQLLLDKVGDILQGYYEENEETDDYDAVMEKVEVKAEDLVERFTQLFHDQLPGMVSDFLNESWTAGTMGPLKNE